MFVWYGQRLSDVFGLDQLFPFSSVLSCDFGIDGKQYEDRQNVRIVAIEKKTGIRQNWSNFSLPTLVSNEFNANLLQMIANCQYVLPYASNVQFYDFVKSEFPEVQYLGVDPDLKEKLDNKFYFRELASELGIKVIPGKIVDPRKSNFTTLVNKFGLPFVVQYALGASGSGTFVVDNEEKWLNAISNAKDQSVLITEYQFGLSFNINAVVTQRQILLAYPSVQLIGLPEISNNKMGYCGNDFAAMELVKNTYIDQIYTQTQKIGEELRKLGYIGLFGLDFIENNIGELFPVEINPRFQGSTQLMTNLQLSGKITPTVSAHIRVFINSEDAPNLQNSIGNPIKISGSQLILHSLYKEPCLVKGLLLPGVYSKRAGKYQYIRPEFTIKDCASTEMLVTSGVPFPGYVVEPEAPLLRIHSKSLVFNPQKKELAKNARDFIDYAYKKLNIVPL